MHVDVPAAGWGLSGCGSVGSQPVPGPPASLHGRADAVRRAVRSVRLRPAVRRLALLRHGVQTLALR